MFSSLSLSILVTPEENLNTLVSALSPQLHCLRP